MRFVVILREAVGCVLLCLFKLLEVTMAVVEPALTGVERFVASLTPLGRLVAGCAVAAALLVLLLIGAR